MQYMTCIFITLQFLRNFELVKDTCETNVLVQLQFYIPFTYEKERYINPN